jgi:hypothetical protein
VPLAGGGLARLLLLRVAYATTLLDVKVGFSKHFTFANYLGFTPIVVPWRKPQRLQGRAAIIFFHHSFWRGGST